MGPWLAYEFAYCVTVTVTVMHAKQHGHGHGSRSRTYAQGHQGRKKGCFGASPSGKASDFGSDIQRFDPFRPRG